MKSMISAQSALVTLMVAVSASDRSMSDAELAQIGEIVKRRPIFKGYDPERLVNDARAAAEILTDEQEGLNTIIGLVRESLPASHLDTAYLLAAEVAAVDIKVTMEEVRILEIIRTGLGLDRLVAAAIDRALTARRRKL